MFFSFKQDIAPFSLCSFVVNNICDPTHGSASLWCAYRNIAEKDVSLSQKGVPGMYEAWLKWAETIK